MSVTEIGCSSCALALKASMLIAMIDELSEFLKWDIILSFSNKFLVCKGYQVWAFMGCDKMSHMSLINKLVANMLYNLESK